MDARCYQATSYNTYLPTEVSADVQLPQIPMGALELLTFFPNHTHWFVCMKRLIRNYFSNEEIARAQLHARGTLTRENRDRREQALRHQVNTGGKTHYADDNWTTKHWKASSHPDSRPFEETYAASAAPHTHPYDVTGWKPNGPNRKVPTLPSLQDIIKGVVNWPTGEDAGPFTQALLWARRQGDVYLATHTLKDVPTIIATQGFTYPDHILVAQVRLQQVRCTALFPNVMLQSRVAARCKRVGDLLALSVMHRHHVKHPRTMPSIHVHGMRVLGAVSTRPFRSRLRDLSHASKGGQAI